MTRVRARVRDLTPRGRCHTDLRIVIADLNPVLRGWAQYVRSAANHFTDLDQYVPIEPIVAGAIDFAHPACAERRHDRVRTEVRPSASRKLGLYRRAPTLRPSLPRRLTPRGFAREMFLFGDSRGAA
jgi:hypothetical protein